MPLWQVEVDTVHGFDVIDRAAQQALLDREPDAQVVDFQHGFTRWLIDRAARGLGAQQFTGVRMLWVFKQCFAGGLFDDMPALHHAHPVGNASHQVEIVADQQDRHAQAHLQVLEQFEDLQLHGDVQGGGGLVGNQQFWLVGQGHGDHHALALPA